MSHVASWASHYLPPDTPVRYLLDTTDEVAPIRLLFGSSEQVELTMPPSVAAPVIAALTKATGDLRREKPQIAVQ